MTLLAAERRLNLYLTSELKEERHSRQKLCTSAIPWPICGLDGYKQVEPSVYGGSAGHPQRFRATRLSPIRGRRRWVAALTCFEPGRTSRPPATCIGYWGGWQRFAAQWNQASSLRLPYISLGRGFARHPVVFLRPAPDDVLDRPQKMPATYALPPLHSAGSMAIVAIARDAVEEGAPTAGQIATTVFNHSPPPVLLGGLMALFLSGAVFMQVALYFQLYSTDRWRIKTLVIAIWMLDVLHSSMAITANWENLVIHYGSFDKLDSIAWSIAITIALTAVTTFIVHCKQRELVHYHASSHSGFTASWCRFGNNVRDVRATPT
ncbi:hypothetical protein VTO73DRAFT_8100 [Trametes versicolor]